MLKPIYFKDNKFTFEPNNDELTSGTMSDLIFLNTQLEEQILSVAMTVVCHYEDSKWMKDA